MNQTQSPYPAIQKSKNFSLFVAFALLLSGSLMALQHLSKENHPNQSISHIPDSLVKVQNTNSSNSINNAKQGKNSRTPCYISKQQSGITEVDLRNCKLDKNTAPNKTNKMLSRV